MKASFAVLLLLLSPGVNWAGGDALLVRKLSFENRMAGGYVVTLEAVVPGESLFGCHRMTINGTYSFWRWKVRRRSPTAPTWKQHRFAVQALAKVNGPFYFGTIGQALERTDEPCTFRSEGLTAEYGTNGSLDITTFYLTS
jgi:hypothetical protein